MESTDLFWGLFVFRLPLSLLCPPPPPPAVSACEAHESQVCLGGCKMGLQQRSQRSVGGNRSAAAPAKLGSSRPQRGVVPSVSAPGWRERGGRERGRRERGRRERFRAFPPSVLPVSLLEFRLLLWCLCRVLVRVTFDLGLFSPQLLPVPAPGGGRGLEDQAELLGVTATGGRWYRRLRPRLQQRSVSSRPRLKYWENAGVRRDVRSWRMEGGLKPQRRVDGAFRDTLLSPSSEQTVFPL